jgi:hypothetical protein
MFKHKFSKRKRKYKSKNLIKFLKYKVIKNYVKNSLKDFFFTSLNQISIFLFNYYYHYNILDTYIDYRYNTKKNSNLKRSKFKFANNYLIKKINLFRKYY